MMAFDSPLFAVVYFTFVAAYGVWSVVQIVRDKRERRRRKEWTGGYARYDDSRS